VTAKSSRLKERLNDDFFLALLFHIDVYMTNRRDASHGCVSCQLIRTLRIVKDSIVINPFRIRGSHPK
jgi:hypothetical protein